MFEVLSQFKREHQRNFSQTPIKWEAVSLKPAGAPPCRQLHKSLKMATAEQACVSQGLQQKSSDLFFFVWFFYSTDCPAGQDCFSTWAQGAKQRGCFCILSHFCWLHYTLLLPCSWYLRTLYRPKSPKSRSTFKALTLGPVVISPATCRRIFTISSGLVKMTWEPPACRERRKEAILTSELG